MAALLIEKDIEKLLPRLINPFIETGLYKDPEEALQNLFEERVDEKIRHYEEEIHAFESKYNITFEGFSKQLSKVTLSDEQEQDWMEWEAALNMLKAWKSVKIKLHRGMTGA